MFVFSKPVRVKKGWGYEEHIISNELYCLKKLVFTEPDSKFSMHFHVEKDETWFVEGGKFVLHILNPKNADRDIMSLQKGDIVRIFPLCIHQIVCVEPGVILEVSTQDKVSDNYRVFPGDSQNDTRYTNKT